MVHKVDEFKQEQPERQRQHRHMNYCHDTPRNVPYSIHSNRQMISATSTSEARGLDTPAPASEEIDHSSHEDAMLLASFADIASKVVAQPDITNKTTTARAGQVRYQPRFPSLPDPDVNVTEATERYFIEARQQHQRQQALQESASPATNLQVSDPRLAQTRPRKISYSNAEIAIATASYHPLPLTAQARPTCTSTHTSTSMNTAPASPSSLLQLKPQPIQLHAQQLHLRSKHHLQSQHTNLRQSRPNLHQRDYKVILRKKFSWKHYPPLEKFLIDNRDEYLRHSALNYTSVQKKFNNNLTEQMIQLASQHGLIFDQEEFSFVTIRDRIRCYYKSYVQSLKKKGIICGYAAKKAGIPSFDGHNKKG